MKMLILFLLTVLVLMVYVIEQNNAQNKPVYRMVDSGVQFGPVGYHDQRWVCVENCPPEAVR